MNITSAIDALSTLLGDRLSRSKSDLDLHGHSESHFASMPPMRWFIRFQRQRSQKSPRFVASIIARSFPGEQAHR